MKKMKSGLALLILLPTLLVSFIKSQKAGDQEMAVIAYYIGNEKAIDNYPVSKLTHIIFSFCHLKGNRLNVDDAGDSATIKKLVTLKKNNPGLKVLLSLGGWGGCEFCSPVFSTEAGRSEFVESIKQLNDYFNNPKVNKKYRIKR